MRDDRSIGFENDEPVAGDAEGVTVFDVATGDGCGCVGSGVLVGIGVG